MRRNGEANACEGDPTPRLWHRSRRTGSECDCPRRERECLQDSCLGGPTYGQLNAESRDDIDGCDSWGVDGNPVRDERGTPGALWIRADGFEGDDGGVGPSLSVHARGAPLARSQDHDAGVWATLGCPARYQSPRRWHGQLRVTVRDGQPPRWRCFRRHLRWPRCGGRRCRRGRARLVRWTATSGKEEAQHDSRKGHHPP